MKLKFDAEGMGKKIKNYRKQQGMKKAEFGRAIGKPWYVVELLEDGNTEPSLALIADIANVLNVEPSWLLAWKPEDEE